MKRVLAGLGGEGKMPAWKKKTKSSSAAELCRLRTTKQGNNPEGEGQQQRGKPAS